MKNGFDSFIFSVKEKTGINLTLYSGEGKKICGIGDDALSFNVEKIYSDKENGKTYFAILNKTVKYIGCINGVTEAEEKFAMLISALAENFDFDNKIITKEEFYNGLLLGNVKFSDFREYIKSTGITDGKCFCCVISAKEKINDVKDVLSNYGLDTDYSCSIEEGLFAFIKYIGQEGFDYASATEYAEYLDLSVQEETGVKTGIFLGGTVNSLYDLNISYNQALATLKIGREFNFSEGVHSYKNYVLMQVLGDLPKNKIEEYLTILTDGSTNEIFKDSEMLSTAEEFINSDLNLSETSRKLFLHRNTLTYRLDKIEKETGLDIRKISDATTFKLIIMLMKLLK